VQQLYDEEYRQAPAKHNRDDSSLEKSFLTSNLEDAVPNTIEDEWKYCLNGQETRIEPGKLFSWWNEQTRTPTVWQMAFDLLSIPVMSAEVERVFSDTKLTISLQRTRLGADIIEAEECERAWLKSGL